MEPGHYFDPTPAAASSPQFVPLVLPDLAMRLQTDRGVFSADRVDPGTRLLLGDAPSPGAVTTALDLGCGYGPIACTLARRAPAAEVWAIDVNERARALCQFNAEANGCPNVRVASPEHVPDEIGFDLIWSNPPIRIGKEGLHALLGHWLQRLNVGGRAVLVVQRHLGADSLARWLVDAGYRVERIASRQGYRLLVVDRSTEGPTHSEQP